MSKFDYLEEMSESELQQFKRCIRKLLDTTFIVKTKDENLYQYVARGSTRQDIGEYLRLIGYNLVVSDEQGVAMLYQDETDDENVGLKRSNIQLFNAIQVKFLLVMWQTYLSKCAYESEVYLSIGELMDKLRFYGVTSEMNQTVFKEAMVLLRKYNLIDFKGNEFDENTTIRLYPSLMFCMDIDQLKQVINDYISEDEFTFDSEQSYPEDEQ